MHGTVREFLRRDGGLYKDQAGRFWTASELLATLPEAQLSAPVSLLYVGIQMPHLTLVRQKGLVPQLARAN